MRQALYVPLAASAVAAALVAVSGLVWLSRGRIAALVRAKLLLGGLLLTLGAGSSACGGTVTCYDVVASNMVALSARTVHIQTDPTVRGTIHQVDGSAFSFAMLPAGGGTAEVARGSLVPDDGAFDESSESFHFAIPADLAPGSYTLVFYAERASGRAAIAYDDVQVVND
jgi:hypothetical protein